MNPIDQAFPGFVQSCAQLFNALLPWGLVLLMLAFVFEFWGGPPSPVSLLKFILKLFLVILLLGNAHTFINEGQTLVQNWVQQNIPARPENVAARYKEKLAQAQNAPELKDKSFWSTLFSSNWFEAIVFAFLTLVSWLAMAIMYFVYGVQRAALLVCWALCPLLIPLLAVRPVSGLGLRHILRIVAILLWPLGNALAATWTDGLLDNAVNQNFLLGQSVAGSLGYGLQNLFAITVIAIWIIFSTVLAPVFIQKMVLGSPGSAAVITRTAELLAGVALPGISNLASAGWQQYRQSTAASEASSNSTNSGAMAEPSASSEPPEFLSWEPSASDPTGEKEVQAILEKTKS